MSLDLIRYDDFDDSWLNIKTSDLQIARNPVLTEDPFFKENPELLIVDLFRSPEYLAYTTWVLFGVRLLPFQAVILAELWNRPFPLFVGCRGLGKTYLLALYSMLRALFFPDYKIVVVGAAFRQSKLVFEYCEKLWEQGPVYRSVCSTNSGTYKNLDKFTFKINSSNITAIPVGTGDKIRGLRANTVIADEFDAHNREIFETVIAGFGAVSASPAENVVKLARLKSMEAAGLNINPEDYQRTSNQMIISGTAGYYFGTFYDYFKKYKAIVESKGNLVTLNDIFDNNIPDNFNWKDYSVIRVPYQLLPNGFMDSKVLSRARATMNKSIFSMEYEACFAEDSDGFYKRSSIERAVANDKNVNNPNWFSWCPQPFDPQLRGKKGSTYVMGVDPASEVDNLAISIVEVMNEHARLAYVWTTNKKDFQERKRAGFAHEDGYQAFVARKIRDMMSAYNITRIGIDTQGGGYALMEALSAKNNLLEGEQPIWTVIDYDKPQDSDRYEGLHIIEPIQFAKYDWLEAANYGLQKDIETGKILFPRFDPVSIELSILEDKERIERAEKQNPNANRKLITYDTLEDAVFEVEELKNELSSIMVERTGMGVNSRLKWTVPEVRLDMNKRGMGRKDRYSSLLIANWLARQLYREPPKNKDQYHVGGMVSRMGKRDRNESLYSGPDWYVNSFNGVYKHRNI